MADFRRSPILQSRGLDGVENGRRSHQTPPAMNRFFVVLVTIVVQAARLAFRSRGDLILEILALRQQVVALKRERPRPWLDDADRGLWVALRSSWPGWTNRLFIVKPETVVRWQRQLFRRYWTCLSRRDRRPGRPRVEAEIRRLIRTMAGHGWGAPRLHGAAEGPGHVR